jgi:ribosomal protein L11 methyltransferase
MSARQHPLALETLAVEVPEAALEAYEAALSSVCTSVSFFRASAMDRWRIEGLRRLERNESRLTAALALAAAISGCTAELQRTPTQTDGWLARSQASFTEQRIGQRFAVRGSHLPAARVPGRITLRLDAGLAFGSGEHGSTRGALRALEHMARRRPRRIVDLGTGSGILAMAAARLLHRPVLAVDIDPRSVRVARQNAATNRLGRLVRTGCADGWRHRAARRAGPYDLVMANILARPLQLMAWRLSRSLAPGGSAILGGFLRNQFRGVLAAHRRHGLRLEVCLQDGDWTTLVLRRPSSRDRT